jgi:hypothetical protein
MHTMPRPRPSAACLNFFDDHASKRRQMRRPSASSYEARWTSATPERLLPSSSVHDIEPSPTRVPWLEPEIRIGGATEARR